MTDPNDDQQQTPAGQDDNGREEQQQQTTDGNGNPDPKDQAPKPKPTSQGQQQGQQQRQADEVREGDVDALPAWARKAIKKANDEAATYRTQKNEAQKEAYRKIGIDLGIVNDDENLTPEELSQRLKSENDDLRKQNGEATARVREYRQGDAIRAAARRVGADEDLLVPYLRGTSSFTKLDTDADDYDAQVGSLVDRAVEQYPKLKATQVAPRSGGDSNPTGDPTEDRPMSIEARREARQKRRGVNLR